MTSRYGKKEKLTLSAGVFVILMVIALGYLLYIQPARTTIKQKELELSNQQKLLEVIKSRNIESSGELIESSVNLQKQIPVEPMVDQFILDLEMAETVSNSQILSIGFAEGGAGAELGTATPEQPADTVDPAQTIDVDLQNIPKPAGIKEIMLDLAIQSKSYYDLEKFIETLEKLERIVKVNSITFSGPAELSSVGTGEVQTQMSFAVNLSIFYYPTLQDLVEDLPEVETESPANKTNPLSGFPDLNEEDSNN
jgi:type IV pilus assembly protein PilO